MVSLRPQSKLSVGEKLKFDDKNFVFLKNPVVVLKETLYSEDIEDTLTDYGSDSDDINYLITYPWYHRCRLWKENKIFVDYDWEEETRNMEEKALNPEDEYSSDEHCNELI